MYCYPYCFDTQLRRGHLIVILFNFNNNNSDKMYWLDQKATKPWAGKYNFFFLSIKCIETIKTKVRISRFLLLLLFYTFPTDSLYSWGLFPQSPLSCYNVQLTGVTDTAKVTNIAKNLAQNYAKSYQHERRHTVQ